MTDLRRTFYNRYKTSSIFNNDTPSIAPVKQIYSLEKTFSPKFKNMTSKERYLNEMRFDIKTNINEKSPQKHIKRSHSIKESLSLIHI